MTDQEKQGMDLFGGDSRREASDGEQSPRADRDAPEEKTPAKTVEQGTAPADHQGTLLKSEETVGEMLIAARERVHQTLDYMSQETKIPKQMLQYLETDNYEALPAKVYAKSFLRTYAMALDLDVQHVLSKYEVQTGQTHRSKGDHWEIESEVVEEKLHSPNLLKRFVVPAVIVLVLIIVIVRLAGRRGERVEPPRQPDLREELLQKKPEAPKVEPPRPQAETPAVPAGVEPMELRIASNPTDSCWFELMTVSVVEQQPETTVSLFTLPPGHERTFQATEEFFFRKVGNAGGFVMELNGNKLPTLGKKGKVITNYKITRENLPKAKRNR